MDGVALRNRILNELRVRVDNITIKPKLVAIVVGNDPASQIYVRNKEKFAEIAGIETDVIRIAQDTTTEKIISVIHELNTDKSVHGILVQLPLPNHIDTNSVLNAVDITKDVDGFTDANIGKMCGSGDDYIIPCTPRGILALLKEYNIDISKNSKLKINLNHEKYHNHHRENRMIEIEEKNAVVVGRSNIVGKPMAQMLLKHNATVTICHSKTQNLSDFTRNADIVISATGKANITGDMLKSGSIFIDVGMQHDENGKLRGDCDFASCEKVAGYITPTPGGVGPMTIAGLMLNLVDLAEKNI